MTGLWRTADVAAGVWFVDVSDEGRRGLFGLPVLETTAGLVLVDPGPPELLGNLLMGLEERSETLSSVAAILLTGSSMMSVPGALAISQRNRRIRIFAPRELAGRLHDPGKLLRRIDWMYRDAGHLPGNAGLEASAFRLILERTEAGEEIGPGGRQISVRASPVAGAVTYRDVATGLLMPGVAFGGATSEPDGPIVCAHGAAHDRILHDLRVDRPESIFFHHFGHVSDVDAYSSRVAARLSRSYDSHGRMEPDVEPYLRLPIWTAP